MIKEEYVQYDTADIPMSTAPKGRKRTGTIYEEFTNPGNVHTQGQFVKGVGMVPRKHRYVAEIQIHYKRYRFRSTSFANCQTWIKDMILKHGEY